jgi:hypothetical protein
VRLHSRYAPSHVGNVTNHDDKKQTNVSAMSHRNVCHPDAPVEHRAEDFCCHDETIRVRLDLDVAGQKPDVKLFTEVPELLVTNRLDRRRVDRLGLVQLG